MGNCCEYDYFFCIFAPNYRNEHLGSTGFDSKWH